MIKIYFVYELAKNGKIYVSYNIIKMNYVIMNDVISILHLVNYRTSFL